MSLPQTKHTACNNPKRTAQIVYPQQAVLEYIVSEIISFGRSQERLRLVSAVHLEKHPVEGSLREVGLLQPLWLILSASERSLMASEAH